MGTLPKPLVFFLLLFSGWVNRQQLKVIEYLKEENRLLREQRQSVPQIENPSEFAPSVVMSRSERNAPFLQARMP